MLLNGTVPPAVGDGADGDFWIDTTTWWIYGPKASGLWPAGVPLRADAAPLNVAVDVVNVATDITYDPDLHLGRALNLTRPGETKITVDATVLGLGQGFSVRQPAWAWAYIEVINGTLEQENDHTRGVPKTALAVQCFTLGVATLMGPARAGVAGDFEAFTDAFALEMFVKRPYRNAFSRVAVLRHPTTSELKEFGWLYDGSLPTADILAWSGGANPYGQVLYAADGSRNASNTVAGEQAVLVLNDGKPYWSFGGSADYTMANVAAYGRKVTGLTMGAAFTPGSASRGLIYTPVGTSGNARAALGYNGSAGTGTGRFKARRLDADVTSTYTGALLMAAAGVFNSLVGAVDYSTGAGYLRMNGTEETATIAGLTTGETSDTDGQATNNRLGSELEAQRFAGKTRGFILFNSLLDATRRTALATALAAQN
jgi:hypothetical protein